MELYQEVMVGLSVSVMKNRLRRPLAEKSPCHDVITSKAIYQTCIFFVSRIISKASCSYKLIASLSRFLF